jgi:hypothetical protein
MKASEGPELHIWGSSQLLQSLIAAQLIDPTIRSAQNCHGGRNCRQKMVRPHCKHGASGIGRSAAKVMERQIWKRCNRLNVRLTL